MYLRHCKTADLTSKQPGLLRKLEIELLCNVDCIYTLDLANTSRLQLLRDIKIT